MTLRIRRLRTSAFFGALSLFSLVASPAALLAQSPAPQHLLLAGLRSTLNQGQFNAVASDTTGNLYLLLDQKDGVRLYKTDSSATTILAQALLGAAGDIGIAMALDPAGNIYITGTSTSGLLPATSGSAFPGPVDSTTNTFIAKFDQSLNLDFVTFGGSGRTAAAAIAATADAVFITGVTYGSTLPVTPAGIIQAPASGSTQNGFVEKFSANGHSLLYSTYLSGFGGDTTPMALAVDPTDNAYVAGFTTAPGFPTIAALVPRIPAPTSGFLTRLTPVGDGVTFSTFIPGAGISSLALDTAAGNLVLSGNIALGQFPVADAPFSLAAIPYQVLLRMPLDGSSVLASTILAPGIQSSLTVAGSSVWVDGTLSTPLLPFPTLANVGTGFAMRVSPAATQGSTLVDQVVRFGGVASSNPGFASLPLSLTSVTIDPTGVVTVAGAAAPTASSDILATQTYDLPLTNAPTAALPSSVHDAVLPPGTCDGSLCAGSAAFLARLLPTAGASLALSTDSSPLILLRNLGSTPASSLQVSSNAFAVTSTCSSILSAGGECSILLSGSGPGSITVNAANAVTQTASLAAFSSVPSPIVFSPRELDFGIQTSTSQPLTRTITVTNLGTAPQFFTSALNGRAGVTPYTFAEQSSDCPLAGLSSSKQLAAGASCEIVISFAASSTATQDGPATAYWRVGSGIVMLTGFGQAAALNLSASTIDFGTQFQGGLSSPRYLFISNNSTAVLSHTAVTLPAGSPFTIADHCSTQLEPHSVCQLQLGYHAVTSTSTDALNLTLDQGLSVLVTGETIPQPATGGSTVNPSLSVSTTAISFPNAVVVTGISNATQTVTIQNTGTSPFPLALALTGDFTDQTDCSSTLAGGASCSAVLTFAPSQPGTRTGLLAVTAGGGTTPVYVNIAGIGTPILPANNGSLDFGSVPLGQPVVQWYKVSQPFSTLTAATLSSIFGVILVEDLGYGHGQLPSSSFLAATTGSCRNCWLGIQFTPASNAAQSSTLTLASSLSGNPYFLELTGSGVALTGPILTPVNQDFGTIAIHSTSAPSLFTLTNVTGSPITVTTPILTGDFSPSSLPSGGATCSGPLAVNASCYAQVLFAPSAAGQRTGTLSVQTSSGSVSANLTGFASPDPGVAFNAAALIFNNVPGNTSTVQTITVTNTSGGPIQIGTPSTATAAFSSTTACGALVPSATCTITVTYTPTNATSTDFLQVPITSAAGGNTIITPYSLPLSATYTAESAGLQILPGTANFGPATVNTLGGTRLITITNLTAKSLALAVALPHNFVLTGPPCAGLAPNASCDFSVSFLPLTNGPVTGTLFAQATPTDGSATINGLGNVQGYGVGTNSLTITGNISPGRIMSFGQVPSGQAAQQVLTLTNTSSPTASAAASTVTVRRITSQWPFLSTSTCGATLSINQSCTVTVAYTPLNQVPNGSTTPPATTDAGVLTIESDAASGPDLIDLTGSASSAAVSAPSNTAPLVSFAASQNSLTFDTTPIGFSSPAQTITLANTGTTVFHVTGISTSNDFTVSSNCSTLVPGASCLLTVAFNPQISTALAGPRSSAIEIASDSSTALEFVSVFGTASPSTLVFGPAALNFGPGLVGTTATLPVLITNAGTLPAIFSTITTTGDYASTSTCPAPGAALQPNAACTITVSFTPTTTGVRPGSLSVASSVSSSALVAALTGVGVQSHLLINPAALSFGSTIIGTTASLSLTLANTGSASITGIQFVATGDYTVTAPCSFTVLSAGASCSVTLAFTPVASGTRTGVLTINSSDPTSPNALALTGNGIVAGSSSNASFSLTVNGGASAGINVQQTRPAVYTLAVAPLNGYTGTVVLTCNAVVAAPGAVCSMLPSSVTLATASQSAFVTINTVTSARRDTSPLSGSRKTTALCVLFPSALFFWGMRKRLRLTRLPASLFLAVLYTTMMFLVEGCGSGGNPNLRITPSGSYQYTVTASSTAGTPLAQTVTLNLTIQ